MNNDRKEIEKQISEALKQAKLGLEKASFHVSAAEEKVKIVERLSIGDNDNRHEDAEDCASYIRACENKISQSLRQIDKLENTDYDKQRNLEETYFAIINTVNHFIKKSHTNWNASSSGKTTSPVMKISLECAMHQYFSVTLEIDMIRKFITFKLDPSEFSTEATTDNWRNLAADYKELANRIQEVQNLVDEIKLFLYS